MKKAIGILMSLTVYLGHAQTGRTTGFNKGDEFEKRVFTVSACVLQQGKQKIDINSSSAVTRQYKVTDADNNRLAITVTTSEVIDTINSMAQQMVYHSQQVPDTTSFIQTALNGMTKNPIKLQVTGAGIISQAESAPVPATNDIILAYSGIQSQPYSAGDYLDLTAAFDANQAYTKGFSWKDSTVKNGVTTVVTYTIESTGAEATSVSFEGSINESSFTTNLSGVLSVDNASGLIVQKVTQTASDGYNVLNGVAYTEIRRTATTEYCLRSK